MRTQAGAVRRKGLRKTVSIGSDFALGLLLNNEHVHTRKGVRVFGFEAVLQVKIGHRVIRREPTSVLSDRAGIHFNKSEKLKIVFNEKALDRRKGDLVLLDVEHQVTTPADIEEVRAVDQKFSSARHQEDL
jgi:hypothetical protein